MVSFPNVCSTVTVTNSDFIESHSSINYDARIDIGTDSEHMKTDTVTSKSTSEFSLATIKKEDCFKVNVPSGNSECLISDLNQSKIKHDAALSQLFHPITFFRSFQSNVDQVTNEADQGEGLFDHLNTSNTPSDPSYAFSNLDSLSCNQVISSNLSKSNISHTNVSVDPVQSIFQNPNLLPTNQQSLHLSTSGLNLPLTQHSFGKLSGLHVKSCTGLSDSQSTVISTISASTHHNRLFDVVDEISTSCSDLLDKTSHTPTPHGLAAYLPRSSSQRSAKVSSFLNEDLPISSVSPKTALSPCTDSLERDFISPQDSKANQIDGSDISSPCKSRGRGKGRSTRLRGNYLIYTFSGRNSILFLFSDDSNKCLKLCNNLNYSGLSVAWISN